MINVTNFTLTPPAPFDFEATAISSGWMELLPMTWDKERQVLGRIERLANGTVVQMTITGASSEQPRLAIAVSHNGELSQAEQQECIAAAGHMLRIDEDFSEFYALCRQRGERWAALTAGLGRLLRSPSVFEDVVKTICTTNTFWAATRGMVKRLVNTYGEPYPGNPDQRAFPTPEAIASVPREAFIEAAHMGYRADYVHTLAQRVVSGELDLEALPGGDISTVQLKKKLLGIKGVGNYAAAVLLTILGRYDELAVDSAFRDLVSRQYFAGQQPSDKEAQAVYADWGKWKYLAFWYDIWTDAQQRRRAKEGLKINHDRIAQ